MSGSRKTRRYESPQRRAQAAATRAQILDAAGRLFVRQGFTATSMASIAAEAGVALKTVYVAFETKSGVLRSLWNLRLRGDGEDRAVQDRAWYLDVLAEPDPRRRLLLNARNSREVKERVDGLFAVIRDAAPTDATSASSGVASSATSTTTRRRSSAGSTTWAPCAQGSTSVAPPTSCGRSTTPTSGCSSSESVAGRPRRTSGGSGKPPAPSSSAPERRRRPRRAAPCAAPLARACLRRCQPPGRSSS